MSIAIYNLKGTTLKHILKVTRESHSYAWQKIYCAERKYQGQAYDRFNWKSKLIMRILGSDGNAHGGDRSSTRFHGRTDRNARTTEDHTSAEPCKTNDGDIAVETVSIHSNTHRDEYEQQPAAKRRCMRTVSSSVTPDPFPDDVSDDDAATLAVAPPPAALRVLEDLLADREAAAPDRWRARKAASAAHVASRQAAFRRRGIAHLDVAPVYLGHIPAYANRPTAVGPAALCAEIQREFRRMAPAAYAHHPLAAFFEPAPPPGGYAPLTFTTLGGHRHTVLQLDHVVPQSYARAGVCDPHTRPRACGGPKPPAQLRGHARDTERQLRGPDGRQAGVHQAPLAQRAPPAAGVPAGPRARPTGAGGGRPLLREPHAARLAPPPLC